MNKERIFKTGNIVRLKSGGPRMTVERRLGVPDHEVRCTWFIRGTVESADFMPEQLVKVRQGAER